MRQSHADNPIGWIGGALAARDLRLFDVAEALLQAGMSRFPRERQLFEAAALLAQSRPDLPEAIRRWYLAIEKFPASPHRVLA